MYEREQRVIDAHQKLIRRTAARVRDYCDREWRGLGSWRDADIDRFIARVVPVVASGEKQVGQLTISYLDSLARLAGYPPTPAAAVTGAVLRNGVSTEEALRRPSVTLYTALSEGRPIEYAVELGVQRLSDAVLTNMQLAQTRTANGWMNRADGVVGYRRVLTGHENCALCALASTQRYHKKDLMPIHPGCDCTVAPIYGRKDPGQVINEERYEQTMKLLKDQGVTDTHSDINNLTIREHGEYGPTLSWRDQHFTKL